jgi:predicted branched-subunit amino acid permease
VGRFLSFPNPVNETSARVVAGGVVALATTAVVADQPWIMVPLAYGFAARVATGPKLSPLGRLATEVIEPRLPGTRKFSPGPPKRFAQAIGLAFSLTALLLHYRFGRSRAAKAVLTALVGAASLEAFLGLCLGCKLFALGMRAGVVPERMCEECRDIWSRG